MPLHHSSQEFRASTGAEWPFLCDPDRVVQKDLGIQEYTDPAHDPMIPHTLVLMVDAFRQAREESFKFHRIVGVERGGHRYAAIGIAAGR